MMRIVPVPPIPPGMLVMARAGKLVPFVGAGASSLVGYPDWAGFGANALQFCVEEGLLNHADISQLRHLAPRTQLSVASSICRSHGRPLDLGRCLEPRIAAEGASVRRLAEAIWRLSRTVVTTNYDTCLHGPLPSIPSAQQADSPPPTPLLPDIISKREDLMSGLIPGNRKVIHLHGSILFPEHAIVTVEQYIQHYAAPQADDGSDGHVRDFLSTLFENRAVVFMGYGLGEMEVLEYVLPRGGRPTTGSDDTRHFILQGFFSHEEALAIHLERYYRESLGVALIPYSRDLEDWGGMVRALEGIGSTLPEADATLISRQMEMDGLLQ